MNSEGPSVICINIPSEDRLRVARAVVEVVGRDSSLRPFRSLSDPRILEVIYVSRYVSTLEHSGSVRRWLEICQESRQIQQQHRTPLYTLYRELKRQQKER